ncbi:M56 family metallopeptidase [Puia sp.]|jgi:beta-lactamase regulating signal transducer with metallopeptidase domain|uniref:M56 family metallopeptidase n=1 Tax=Puia sp. TaxID=2045100 RepID=UPI002F42BB4C
MNMIPDTILRALCWALLHSLWQGLILAVVAGTIMVLTKKASSALRYNLLCCGMILFLAANGYTFYLELHAADPNGVSPVLKHLTAGEPGVGAAVQDAASNPVVNVARQTTDTFRKVINSIVQYFNTHAGLVVVIWFIIFLARFVNLLSGLVYTQRIRHYQTTPASGDWQQRLNELLGKLKINRPVLLLESALIKVPVVVGFLKPAVLVPIGILTHLPADQVESILLHELAHIRRKDYLFNLVQHVVDTLFFFNPALVWISSLIRAERENCCDDITIRETRSRRQLIQALVSFHEYRQREGQFAISFAGTKENPVVKRVKRIVYKTNHSLNAGERVILMSVLLVLCAAFVTIKSSNAATPETKRIAAPTIAPAVAPAVTDTTIKGVKSTPAHPPKPAEQKHPKEEQASGEQADSDKVSFLGYHNLSLDKLIEMKEHGVNAGFILSFRKMGYGEISPDQAIRLVDHGVTVEFIKSLIAMGYEQPSLDFAVQLIDHGVSTGFIARLKDLGFSKISLEKAEQLIDHGVTGDYIAACKKKFGKLFELNDYIKLRDAGINPAE